MSPNASSDKLSHSPSPPHRDPDNAERGANPSATTPLKISHWRSIIDQGVLTREIEEWHYEGSGTEEDPYQVKWLEGGDPRNPMEWKPWYRWMVVLSMALAVLGVSLSSSMFSGGLPALLKQYPSSEEVGILGLSLFVIGFAIGPLFWAPLSEMFGRQILFALTYGMFTIWSAGVAGANNLAAVIVMRFLAGSFGSSPLTNAGGVIADCFPARDRGLAMSIFASAPFLGPAVGPVIGGFLGETAGWRWVMGFMAALAGLAWFVGMLLVPETYAPVLLRKRAAALSKKTGKVYRSKLDIDQGHVKLADALKTSLTRPWVLLLREPIVSIMSVYMAIVYGTLYMLFAAFPIVFTQGRHWSQGIGGLAFIGVLIGMMAAVAYSIWIENPRYQKVTDQHGGVAPPEARLPPSILGGVLLPIGLFWFAWTNGPSVHWAVSIAAGIPFGGGMVLVFLSIMNYLIDSYTIFAASVLAANAVLRSVFGAVFPLFTTYMYEGLGIHWASSIPAFLALVCVPFPVLFYKYGAKVRSRCKFAAESEAFMKKMRGDAQEDKETAQEKRVERAAEQEPEAKTEEEELEEEEYEKRRAAKEAADVPGASRRGAGGEGPRYEGIRTGTSTPRRKGDPVEWDNNPYVIERVHTRESFKSGRTGRSS